MQIRNLHRTGWPSNCYLVYEGSDAVVIDPSAHVRELTAALAEAGLSLRAILLTHGHFDHILSLDTLRDATGAKAYLHRGDADFPGDAAKSCYLTLIGRDIRHRAADVLLEGGEVVQFGRLTFTVLHTPGHTGGCVCYRAGDALFTGDTLFAEGYGRTDLPGGDPAALRQSLARLTAMRDEPLTIYPGHGELSGLADAVAML
ncbi:MAG: MBL fold metallo-hydrolase [Clostridia bacterium]|nr:MBL fold metallo-hydrolase [Clostridia bacterium]